MIQETLNQYKLILASASPRRKALLQELGFEFDVVVKPVEEKFPADLHVLEVAEYLSNLKMSAYQDVTDENVLIITADTVVVYQDEIIGKPQGADDAVHMLQQLSGHKHTVVSGVTLKCGERRTSFSVSTEVWFRQLSEDEIQYYVSEYKPLDKAGSYGIQEWIGYIGVEKIEGSFYNVMGLPTQQLYSKLNEFLRG